MRTCPLLLTLLLVGCARSLDVSLPRVGNVGDFPPTAETVVVTLARDGSLAFEGRPVRNLRGLHGHLVQWTGERPRDDRHPYLPSCSSVLIRCDRDARFARLAQVLRACVDPEVRVNRIFYAVLPLNGEEEGAFAWFLPHDDCLCNHPGKPPRVRRTARVAITADAEKPVDPHDLYAALVTGPAERLTGCVSIRAHAVSRVGTVLTVAMPAVWLVSWSVSNVPPSMVMLLLVVQNLVSPATSTAPPISTLSVPVSPR